MKRRQRRILIHNESEYPSDEVRVIVRRALVDLDVEQVRVRVRSRKNDSRRTTGYYREYWYPSRGEDRPQILITLPRPGLQPHDYVPYARVRGECPTFGIRSWREKLLAIAAHEGLHHKQTPRNAYGSRKRGRYVESECDMAAFRAVMRYRKEGNDEETGNDHA